MPFVCLVVKSAYCTKFEVPVKSSFIEIFALSRYDLALTKRRMNIVPHAVFNPPGQNNAYYI